MVLNLLIPDGQKNMIVFLYRCKSNFQQISMVEVMSQSPEVVQSSSIISMSELVVVSLDRRNMYDSAIDRAFGMAQQQNLIPYLNP
jgi:hypothetical protein